MARQRVASLKDIEPGELRRVDVDGVAICLIRLKDGTVCAVNDTCTHEFASLSDGELYGGGVQCPMHGSIFDAKTGNVTGMPAVEPVSTYPVDVEDSEIFVTSSVAESGSVPLASDNVGGA